MLTKHSELARFFTGVFNGMLYFDKGYLDHEEVLVDNTVVGETTHGGDLLVSHIKLGAALVAVLILLAHPVHLLVHLCSVVEAHLTRASHSPGDTGWMPGTNAGNLHMQSAISFFGPQP